MFGIQLMKNGEYILDFGGYDTGAIRSNPRTLRLRLIVNSSQ